MKIIDIIKEEIERYAWGKKMVAGKPIIPDKLVYHGSDPKNRESILRNGIEPRVGDSYSSWTGGRYAIPAVFATNGGIKNVTGGMPNFNADIWAISTDKINNEWFEDNHFNEFKKMGFKNPHIVTFTKIPPNAIALVHKA